MDKENLPAEVRRKKREFTKSEKQGIALNVFLGVITSLVIGVSDMLCDLSRYKTISDFFALGNLADIGLVTLVSCGLMAMMFAYINHCSKRAIFDKKKMSITCICIIFTYVVSVFIGQYVNLYVVPIILCGLLVATLVDRNAGIMVNIIVSLMLFVAFILFFNKDSVAESIASLLTAVVSGTVMILCIVKSKTRIKFLCAGFGIGFVSAFIPVFAGMIFGTFSFKTLLALFLWSFVSSVCSLGLYMLLLPILEQLFRVDSVYRISELCSFNAPLLKRLAKEAPGTFYHSMMVGNLVELCASEIGENPMLAKACAYYHDVGKMQKPEYFVENQKDGVNVHDELIPEVSVQIITNHTDDGYRILREYHIPDEIANVAREHHGTTPVKYFYYKAQNITEDQLKSSQFAYNDPKPSSKIAAIVMIVDTVEAAIRAVGVRDDLREFVHKLIKEKADMNQFSECPITFADIQKIEDVLVDTIPNMFHSRIKYDNKR